MYKHVCVCVCELVQLFYWMTFDNSPLFTVHHCICSPRAGNLSKVLLEIRLHPLLWPFLLFCAVASCAPFHVAIEFYLLSVPRSLLIHLSFSLCCEGFILLWISLLSFSWSQEKGKTTWVVSPLSWTGTPFPYSCCRCWFPVWCVL